jgi:hypothetical protein
MRRSTRLATVPRAMRVLLSATSLLVLMGTPVVAQTRPDPDPVRRVPEMSSTLLLASALVGLGGLGLWSRRKWRRGQ